MENKKCDCKDCQCGGTKQSTTAFDIWTAPDWSVFNNSDWGTIQIKEGLNWDMKWTPNGIEITQLREPKTYNPEKYDLVEKKDYKIKNIKSDIEKLDYNIEVYAKEYRYFIKKAEERIAARETLQLKKQQLEQELKELESKKKE